MFSACKTVKLLSLVAGGLLLASLSLRADSVTVQQLNVSPSELVEISDAALNNGKALTVQAGVIDLLVDGVSTDGFCIDPFHLSTSGVTTDSEVSLQSAPKPPPGVTGYTGMGSTAATEIEDLWAMNYTSALTNARTAAGLQIAIWEVVASTLPSEHFKVLSNDYGAQAMITALAGYTGPTANLEGLTGSGQDYAIQAPDNNVAPSVPDTASTAGLFVAALGGLFGLNWLRNRRRVALAGCVE